MLRQRPRASMLRPVRRGLLRPACTLTAAARICPRSRSQAIQPREQRRVAVLPAVHVGDPADSAGPAETSGAGRPLGDAPRRPSGQPHRVPDAPEAARQHCARTVWRVWWRPAVVRPGQAGARPADVHAAVSAREAAQARAGAGRGARGVGRARARDAVRVEPRVAVHQPVLPRAVPHERARQGQHGHHAVLEGAAHHERREE
mmetsp:Transcript_22446/g.66841  ORF Transcript_22446/g.66841 Transcript_22446/m.66841 type:complete len:203 (-) Transcript_22446:657-1265(-)